MTRGISVDSGLCGEFSTGVEERDCRASLAMTMGMGFAVEQGHVVEGF